MSLPNWHRAHGEPLFHGQLRHTPEDFRVCEQLGWELSGDGEHDYLWLEKINANTDWVAQQLANYAGVPLNDVGYAGLKDRHAITEQWFSVPRWHAPDWSALSIEGVRLLKVGRHLRKLRRGAHRANAFRIVVRPQQAIDRDALTARIEQLRLHGVPNYFGEQRFGREGNNLRLADSWAAGRRLSRNKRSLAISTIRSWVFNNALSERVQSGHWNVLQPGDLANLDGSASVFDITEVNDTLRTRCAQFDIHPALPLVGEGYSIEPEKWQRALGKARVEPGNRSLRLRLTDLSVSIDENLDAKTGDNKDESIDQSSATKADENINAKVNQKVDESTVVLCFMLPRGAYATSVLRELCDWN